MIDLLLNVLLHFTSQDRSEVTPTVKILECLLKFGDRIRLRVGELTDPLQLEGVSPGHTAQVSTAIERLEFDECVVLPKLADSSLLVLL